MPVSAPADKRFRRVHVRPGRRHRAWTTRLWQMVRTVAVTALGMYSVYWGASLVLSAEALHVTRISVSGNERMSRGEVIALLDGLHGQSMVRVDLDEWRHKLMTSPWVADAAMRRTLPGTIAVAISERQPMGIGRIGEELYLIDQRGLIIDQYGPNYSEFDLPIVDGLTVAPREGAPLIDEARAALAARVLAALQKRPDLARRVSQVDVSDARDAMLVLKGDTALVRIGDEQFVERLQSYVDLAPTLRERVPEIDYVDLRFDERVYVKPQRSGARRKGSNEVQAMSRRAGSGSREDPGRKGRLRQ
jgi:cell division protein FtsQ